MRNPRPCECGHLKRSHTGPSGADFCVTCSFLGRLPRCLMYRPAKRTEPLRAPETWISQRWLRRFIDAELAAPGATADPSGYSGGWVDALRAVRERFCD